MPRENFPTLRPEISCKPTASRASRARFFRYGAAHAIERAIKAHQALGAAMVEGDVFCQKPDPAPRPGGAKRISQHESTSMRGPHETHCEVDGSAFASSVRPQETKNLALLNLQRELVEGT